LVSFAATYFSSMKQFGKEMSKKLRLKGVKGVRFRKKDWSKIESEFPARFPAWFIEFTIRFPVSKIDYTIPADLFDLDDDLSCIMHSPRFAMYFTSFEEEAFFAFASSDHGDMWIMPKNSSVDSNVYYWVDTAMEYDECNISFRNLLLSSQPKTFNEDDWLPSSERSDRTLF